MRDAYGSVHGMGVKIIALGASVHLAIAIGSVRGVELDPGSVAYVGILETIELSTYYS